MKLQDLMNLYFVLSNQNISIIKQKIVSTIYYQNQQMFIYTFTVSIYGMFNKSDLGLLLCSESNEDVPLSFDPSDSITKKKKLQLHTIKFYLAN